MTCHCQWHLHLSLPSPPAPVQARPVQRAGRGMKGEGAWTSDPTLGRTRSALLRRVHRRGRPLFSINRAVEDIVRYGSLVYQLPGIIPFDELSTGAKRPHNGAARKIGDGAGTIWVRKT